MDPIRRSLLGLASGVILLASCTPKETKALLQPAQALGTILAEETTRLAGAKKQVAVISPDASWGEISTAEQAFRNALRKDGFTVTVAKAAHLGDSMRRGTIGLKAEDFLDALQKSAEMGALVSFAGLPLLSPADSNRVPQEHPPVLVVATASLGNVPGIWGDRAQLAGLLENKTIQRAIIDTSEPASPTGAPDPIRQLFFQHYTILQRPD